MLRAVIIDDEQRGINTLKLLVQKFVPHDVKIVAETTEAEKGVGLIEDYKPEIVFLDINMPFLNGFQVLELLNYREFHLIFTTAHEEFALKAIKNNALDYLLKPIVAEHLRLAVEKAKDKIASKQSQPDLAQLFNELKSGSRSRFPITNKDGTDYVYIEDIIRLEADSNYTKVILVNGKTGLNPKTLKEYESMLCTPGSHFMRIHQSHIVNLKFVSRFLKEDPGLVITKDNAQIPLSKHKRDEFMSWLKI